MENEEIQLKPNIGGARKVARKLHKDAGIKEIPVNLAQVIRYLQTQYALDVIRHPLTEKVSGMLVMIDGEPTIGFNGDMAWVRRRFTIAHEIGHLLIGHTCEGPGAHSNAELEAHQFAAELLIPLAFIKADFARQRDLDVLGKKYIVSKEALCRHLMECKLL